jgi:predicted HTH transcriptional regulator
MSYEFGSRREFDLFVSPGLCDLCFMAVSYVHRMIAEGEHQQQDFKMRVDDSRKIARTLVAFANSEGGRLLIGVKDNGQVAGIRPEEELHMLEAAADLYCRPRVPFDVQLWKSDFRTVLEIRVEASFARPHHAETEPGQWRAFIRRGDQNLPAPGVLIEVWRHGDEQRPVHYTHTEKEIRMFGYMREHESGLTLSQLARFTRIQRPELIRLLARFIRWGSSN